MLLCWEIEVGGRQLFSAVQSTWNSLEPSAGRALAEGAGAPGLSFGDGAHKCPGSTIAILETDVFLQELFALPVRMESPPRVSINGATGAYELRGLVVALDRG